MVHFFFFNDTATTEIYTLSLHDALPICRGPRVALPWGVAAFAAGLLVAGLAGGMAVFVAGRALQGLGAGVMVVLLYVDRKSTRLNSSHANISYAGFCLKKKKTTIYQMMK